NGNPRNARRVPVAPKIQLARSRILSASTCVEGRGSRAGRPAEPEVGARPLDLTEQSNDLAETLTKPCRGCLDAKVAPIAPGPQWQGKFSILRGGFRRNHLLARHAAASAFWFVFRTASRFPRRAAAHPRMH